MNTAHCTDGQITIAIANIRIPSTPADSVDLATTAITEAGHRGADVICFPECFVPGYRWPGAAEPGPSRVFLDEAWAAVASSARKAGIAVVLGTERLDARGLLISALVINADGTVAGWHDKEQLDPSKEHAQNGSRPRRRFREFLHCVAARDSALCASEEPTYVAGEGRRVFTAGPLTFGVAICHEGWRYPETVRWAARRGAQVVFHPHLHVAETGSYCPSVFADPVNTFHEKAMLCRAAENTCYFASVNCATEGSGTTPAVIRPDGTVQCYQPYGVEELLIADLDLSLATGLLASRCRTA